LSTAADAGGDKPPARVVVDANTLISAAIGSKKTPPADIYTMVDRALASTTVVIVCPRLLDETERSFSKRKLARLVHPDEVQDVMKWILGGSKLVTDPSRIERVCRDPKDDYIVALAREQRATIVSGDADLLVLKKTAPVPILSPREYLDLTA